MSSSVIQGYSSELPLFFSTSALNFFGSGLSSSPFSNNVSALPEILYGPQRAHSTRVPSPVLIPHFADFSQTGQVSRIIIPPLSSIKLAHQRATRTPDPTRRGRNGSRGAERLSGGKEKPSLRPRNHSKGGFSLANDIAKLYREGQLSLANDIAKLHALPLLRILPNYMRGLAKRTGDSLMNPSLPTYVRHGARKELE